MITSIFTTVTTMLVYMLLGFLLCKARKSNVAHAKSFSALLLYILCPCMIINSFLHLEYTKDNLIKIAEFFFVTLAVQLLFFVILFMVLHKKYVDSKYRILSIGSVLGNVGFMGMPVIASVFPAEPIVLCYSSIYVMTMNLIVYTIGAFLITNNKKYVSIKTAFLNPTSVSLIVSIPIYILKIKFSNAVYEPVGLLAKMVTPMCMIILGMRLSAARLKEVFARGFVYATCVLKLVIFPIFAMLIVWWLPWFDNVFKTTVVVLSMTPSGAIIESLAELHECEQELAANVVLLTTILSVATIPMMAFLLI